jgi:hypothetical protein
MIMVQQIRNHPIHSCVQDLEIVPAPEQPSPRPNWRVMWTLSGVPRAPLSAQDIERDVQCQFMLA